ncbi:MAG TPA: zinc ABC transporter substrate-binding protein [Solirubrobacteraceae bacterium]|nr:zinc ABC transporter substrate-binding protein [Solirubrobacteraceae bacterium]
MRTLRPSLPAKVDHVAAIVLLLALAWAIGGCGRSGAPGTAGGRDGRVQVVAAENFWGSIAAQLGGARARVSSVIVDPATDPHSYEPTARDARAMARAQLAIVNGLGYDEWAPRLLQASPSSARTVLDVGERLGLHDGANPHQWYSPQSVRRVAGTIASDYARLDPRDGAYFKRREQLFLTGGLARYNALVRQIRSRYEGTPVGYSESIFRPLGEALGLRLLTPYGFARAVADGTEVTAADKRTVDEQARKRQIEIWVFNRQNVTPEVQRINDLARQARIPIATVSETLAPAGVSFQRWQTAQLEGIERALREATGR